MIWRSLVIVFSHITVALLIWAGYSWIAEGYGLNPLIAFPFALVIYIWHLLWVFSLAEEYDADVKDVLEMIEELKAELKEQQRHL